MLIFKAIFGCRLFGLVNKMRKVTFSVIDTTSEADGHGVRNLEHQHPASPGWQTQKYVDNNS